MMSSRSAGACLKAKVYYCLGVVPPCLVQAAGSFSMLAHNCKTAWHYNQQGHDVHADWADWCIGSAEDICWKVPTSNLGKGTDNSEVCSSWRMLGCNFIRQWLLPYQLFHIAGHEYSHCDSMCMIWETDSAESCYITNHFCFVLSCLSSCLPFFEHFFLYSFLQ